MGIRRGEDKAPLVPIRQAGPRETEFIKATPQKRKPKKPPLLGEDGQPVKRKRGRPKKSEILTDLKARTPVGEPLPEIPKGKYPAKMVSKLSDFQLDEAMNEVVMGERVSVVAQRLGVSAPALAEKMKARFGLEYMRDWQQSVAFDCLRAEIVLKHALKATLDSDDYNGPKWGTLVLRVLEYRAKVLGFGAVNPQEQTIRVAGLDRDEVFAAILAKM